jgi:hypothetical protein
MDPLDQRLPQLNMTAEVRQVQWGATPLRNRPQAPDGDSRGAHVRPDAGATGPERRAGARPA